MLSAAQRLRRRGEFAAAVRTGRRASRGVLVVHLVLPDPTPEPGTGSPRAGFIVPKAVGGAVLRNKVKRRLRHLVRDRIAHLPPGLDLVVRALPAAADRTYQGLAADLDGALTAAQRKAAR